jgi:ABC-type transport system substrate-binding protein
MTAQVRPRISPAPPPRSDGAVQLVQAGVSINPDGCGSTTPGANKDRPWLQSEELRRAISYAVDRQAFADTVFLGAAKPIYGPITPGNPSGSRRIFRRPNTTSRARRRCSDRLG